MILPLPTLLGIEVVILGLLEYKRYEGFKKTGKVSASDSSSCSFQQRVPILVWGMACGMIRGETM